jgi:succinoglycan biosynthesis transport protein ExoP
MSKNFELMQRAGRFQDIQPPRKLVTMVPPQPAKLWKHRRTRRTLSPDQLALEESSRLVQQIFLLQSQPSPRVVVFAGIDHGNGCSRICAQTAEILQQNVREPVCIVEANFRSPSLPQMLGVANHHGLTDALLGDGPIQSYARPVLNGNLSLLSAGAHAADGQSLLNSDRLRIRFDELRSEFGYVLVDAPPLARYSDAIAVGKISDGVVLVLEADSTRREAALRVSDYLRASQIPVLAAVLNKRTFPIPDSLYRFI